MDQTFVATAWNNGQHHSSGAGYGLKVSPSDRDRYFDRRWGVAELHLPALDEPVRVNIDKASFWSGNCRELISREIGQWFQSVGRAPWPSGSPPRVELRPRGNGAFHVRLASDP
jgi:hypothetical protein